ncbi:MAG: YecA family protein [Gammaproteobacteria bacterium]|nr:YecA family protein [Gammaproteobacteria bacterium]
MTILSHTQLQHLDNTLQQGGGVSIFTAHGLLTALNCYPVVLPIEEWLPLLWGEERSFDNWQEMANLFVTLGELNHHIAAALKNNQLLPLVDYDARTTFDFAKLSEAQQEFCLEWCAGFVEGLACDMAFWTEDSNEEVLTSIMAISALAQMGTDHEEEDDEDYEDEDLDEISDEDEDEDYEDEEDGEDYEEEDDIFDEEEEDYEEEDEILLTEEEFLETMQNLPLFIARLHQHKLSAQPALETNTES